MRLTMIIILMLALTCTLLAQGTKPPERLGLEAEKAGDDLFNAKDRAGAAQKYEEALGHFQQAEANGVPQTKEIEGLNDKLFKAYYFSGQFDKAIAKLQEKLDANPRDYKTAKTIAQIYEKKLNDLDNAIATMSAFDAANPNFNARKAVAGYYQDKGDTAKAIEWYRKATEIKTDARVIQMIAKLYRESGDNANAVKAYRDFLATNPDDKQKERTYTNMGALYEDMKDFPKAIESYENALKISYDKDIATKLLTMYYDQGEWDNAMAKINQMLGKNANDETAIYFRALIKVKQNDNQGAIADFEKLVNSSKYGADAKANIKALRG